MFFLDEPTSGLDPITSSEPIGRLRDLANRSATVVFTTHSVDDLAACDRVVCVTRGGRLGFVGTVDEALKLYDVGSVPELYRHLTDPDANHQSADTAAGAAGSDVPAATVKRRPVASGLTQ